MTINFYAIYKYFHSCSNDWHFNNLMHQKPYIIYIIIHFPFILYTEEVEFVSLFLK